jgi:hypothetical protein
VPHDEGFPLSRIDGFESANKIGARTLGHRATPLELLDPFGEGA